MEQHRFAGGDAPVGAAFIAAPLLGGALAAAVASFLAVAEVTKVEEPGLGATGEPVEAS
jgi:hypothetical protein